MTNVQLSRQQVNVLLVRLREQRIRPNLVTTSLWQLGWLVPPLELWPTAAYLAYFLWFGGGYMGLLILVIERFGVGSPLYFVTLGGFAVANTVLHYATARNRAHAVLALACLIGVPVVYVGWLLAQPLDTDNIVPPVTFSSLFHDTFVRTITIALLICLPIRHYWDRRKLGGLKWREMVEEIQVANIF